MTPIPGLPEALQPQDERELGVFKAIGEAVTAARQYKNHPDGLRLTVQAHVRLFKAAGLSRQEACDFSMNIMDQVSQEPQA